MLKSYSETLTTLITTMNLILNFMNLFYKTKMFVMCILTPWLKLIFKNYLRALTNHLIKR